MSSLAFFLPPIAHSAVFALDLMTQLLLGCEIWQSLTTGKALKNKKTRKHIQVNNAAVLFFLCKYYVEYKSCFFSTIIIFIYTGVYTGTANNRESNLHKYKLVWTCFIVEAKFGLSIPQSGIYPFSLSVLMSKWSFIMRPCEINRDII